MFWSFLVICNSESILDTLVVLKLDFDVSSMPYHLSVYLSLFNVLNTNGYDINNCCNFQKLRVLFSS